MWYNVLTEYFSRGLNMKYISKKEKVSYYTGLAGQNLVYSLIGGSFFTYFMTDIAMFPAIVVSVLLIVMKVWDGINDPIVGSMIDKHTFKTAKSSARSYATHRCPWEFSRCFSSLCSQPRKASCGFVSLTL